MQCQCTEDKDVTGRGPRPRHKARASLGLPRQRRRDGSPSPRWAKETHEETRNPGPDAERSLPARRPVRHLRGLVDTWQLIINTVTTIITFLMVALLQNSQTRSDQALQHKLNAIADGLADLMAYTHAGGQGRDLERDLIELRAAVGLEEHESSSGNRAADKRGS
jgi:hypothetical protein